MERNGNQISYSTTVYPNELSLDLKGSVILTFFKNTLMLKEYYLTVNPQQILCHFHEKH